MNLNQTATAADSNVILRSLWLFNDALIIARVLKQGKNVRLAGAFIGGERPPALFFVGQNGEMSFRPPNKYTVFSIKTGERLRSLNLDATHKPAPPLSVRPSLSFPPFCKTEIKIRKER